MSIGTKIESSYSLDPEVVLRNSQGFIQNSGKTTKNMSNQLFSLSTTKIMVLETYKHLNNIFNRIGRV